MIKGVHAMFYTSDPDGLRAFLRDKLGFGHTDVGGGWLIFDVPHAEVAAHPVDADGSPPSGTHDISFWCDDIEATVVALRDKGVAFADEVSDQGYGLAIHFEMPGGVKAELYQPHYRTGGS